MASTQVETVTTGVDKAKLTLVGLLVVAGIGAYYFLAGRGALIQWAGLLAGLVLAVVVFMLSEPGQRLVGFSRAAWRETQKVVWPSRNEALRTAAFVVAFSVVMALTMWIADQILQWALYDLILGWK